MCSTNSRPLASFILTGDMKVTGGIVDLYQDTNGLHLGALQVVGTVTFEGGTYIAKIVGTPTTGERERNRWLSTGTFTTDEYANITPVVTSTALGVKTGSRWNVISAGGAFPAVSPLPTVAGGFTDLLYSNREEYDLVW